MSAQCEQLSSSKHRQAQARIVTTSEAASQQQHLLPTNNTFTWMLGDEPVKGTTPTVSANERRRSSATLALYLTKYYFYQRRELSSTEAEAAIYRDPVVDGANSDVNCTTLATASVAFETTPWNQLGNNRQLKVALDDCVNLHRQQDDANNTTSALPQTTHNSSVSPSLTSSSSSTASSHEPRTATSCSRLAGEQTYLASRVQAAESQQGAGSLENQPDKRQQTSGCHFIQNSDSAFSLNSSASTQTAVDSRQIKGALEYQDSTSSSRNQIAQINPSKLVTHHQDEVSNQRTQSYLSSWFQSSQRLANTSSVEYQLRRNSSPVEEQLRRLLDLEPVPDNQRTREPRESDRNKWTDWKQVVTSKSAQQVQRKFSLDIEGAAMKRKSSELAPTGKLGNNSDERDGYSYKQSSSSKQLSPDDRLMIFMLASRSTTSNTQVERNARILKWLNNCRSAY